MLSGRTRSAALMAVLTIVAGLPGCDNGAHLVYGFIDDQGQWVVAPEYADASPPAEGLIAVQKGGAWGFVDHRGRSVIEWQFDAAQSFAEGLAAVRNGDEWRYIDRTGRTVIAGPFAKARPFDGGLAAVRTGTSWGFVNHAGNLVIEPRFEDLAGDGESWISSPCFSEGLCAAKQDGAWGFIDRGGRWVIAARFAEVQSFHEGLAAVREAAEADAGKVGFIDRRGEMVISPRFEGSLWFSGGRAIAAVGRPAGDADAADDAGLKIALIDPAGNVIADVGWGPVADVFDQTLEALSALAPDYLGEGLVPASQGDRWGFMDRDGQWVIPPSFALVLPFRNGVAPAGMSDDPDADALDVQRWGLIDARGRWVVEPRLTAMGSWGGAYTWARRHTRWGLVDRDGHWRVEPVYADAHEWFELPGSRMPPGEGLQRAGVYANHRWSVADRRGRRSPAVEFEWLAPVGLIGDKQARSRRFSYMERGLWGIADEKLKPITPALFDERPRSTGRDGIVAVSQDGWWGCTDLEGRWIVRPQSSEMHPCDGDETESAVDWVGHGADASWRPGENGYSFYRHEVRQPGVAPVDEVTTKFMSGDDRHQGAWLGFARRGDRWGVIDERGKEVLPVRYEEVGAVYDGLYAIRSGGKWGIVDGRGREVFAPVFERAMPFSRDVAIFCEGKLCGLVAKTGEVIVPPTWSGLAPLSDRLAVTMMWDDDGRMKSSGLVDSAGSVLVGQEYYTIASFSDYLLKTWDARGYHGLLQKSDGQPVPGLPDITGQPGGLSEGLAAVDLRTADGESAAGYIDARGRLVIAPRFDAGKAGAFDKGVAIVREGGRCGAIDRRGKQVLATAYQHCQRLPDGRFLFAEEAPVRFASPPPAEAGTTPP